MSPSKRIAITIGAAALCVGMSAPAWACPPSAPSSAVAAETISAHKADSVAAHKTTRTPAEILAHQKASVDAFVARAQAGLQKVAARVAADPGVSAEKKVAIDAKLVRAEAALATLKEKVDAATTLDGLHAVIHDAIDAWRSAVAASLAAKAHHKTVRAVHRDTSSADPALVAQHARSGAVHSAAQRFQQYRAFLARHRGDWGRGWHRHHRGGADFGGHHHHHHG